MSYIFRVVFCLVGGKNTLKKNPNLEDLSHDFIPRSDP